MLIINASGGKKCVCVCVCVCVCACGWEGGCGWVREGKRKNSIGISLFVIQANFLMHSAHIQ